MAIENALKTTGKKTRMERKYAVILGNLGNTRDRFCTGYKENPSPLVMLKQAAAIPLVSGIELVGTWDISRERADEMHSALQDLNLACVSIIPDLFGNRLYWKGAFSSTEEAVRQHAIDSTMAMCDVAGRLGCPTINLWPGQDGYDYLLCTDYERERDLLCRAVAELAERNPHLRFALEYKPKEPRTHSYLARMADTLLLCQETGQPNVGVTIDTGHAFVGGENVSESIILAKRCGNRLMHMHFNDNHTTTDDDMIVASVHTIAYLEMLFWLARCEYKGWLSMDQYPYREPAAEAIGESIQWLELFITTLEDRHAEFEEVIQARDAVRASAFLRGLFQGNQFGRLSGATGEGNRQPLARAAQRVLENKETRL